MTGRAPDVRGGATRPLATIRVDARGTIVGWDAGARALYGYEEEEVLGIPLRDLHLEPGATPALGGSRASEALARSEARFRALVQHSSDLVSIVDRHLVITYVSPSVLELLGVTPSATLGRHASTVVHRDDREPLSTFLAGLLDEPGSMHPTLDVRLRNSAGEWRVFEVVATNQLDDPAVGGIVINGRDVTERRLGDMELRHRATHDPLTDLANRSFFLDQLAALIEAEPDRAISVVAVGLDRFQTINESLGHHAGDQVLVTCAERLRRALPAAGILARVGGDTFVAAVPQPHRADPPRVLAGRLLAALREPFRVAGRLISMSARAGIAVSDGHDAAATLLRHADASLHRAKALRSDAIAVFEPDIGDQANRRLELEQALPHAVANGELRVHLQPIVTTDTGTPVGVEALVRWEHPTLGLVPPVDFIPLAEETGDIIEIGRWVLERSCELVAGWNSTGRQFRLSVNLSPHQFLEPGFASIVQATLQRTGFDPSLLTLEVTESVLVEEGSAATDALQAVRDLDVRLAIDDFGTGYSSLVYLRRLHVDALKIDKSFIVGLASGSDDDTIVRTIIELAGSLGLSVVAEGVETEEQRQRLVHHGCPHAQGFLFAHPLEPDALIDLVGAPGSDLLPNF